MLRKLGCRQLVADIFQDLVERMLKRPAIAPKNPRSYLFQAAANAITDYYRSEQCRLNYSNSVKLEYERDHNSITPERILAAKQTISIISAALAELPPLTQKIFHLYRMEELSQEAIAKNLGISRSTVERRLKKAVKHWQGRIKQHQCDTIC